MPLSSPLYASILDFLSINKFIYLSPHRGRFKPIFEREEVKSASVITEKIVGHHTIVAINNENLDDLFNIKSFYFLSSFCL